MLFNRVPCLLGEENLYGKLQTYVNSGGKSALSDEFAQVYSLADGIRIWRLEMKQKFLMEQSNDEEEKQAREMVEVNPETLAQQCIQKSLLLLSFLSARTKAEGRDADNPEDLRRSHQDKRQRTSSIVKSDFQASDATPLCGGATCLASPVAGGAGFPADGNTRGIPP
ncbi:hypothetical protein JRQ81_014194 [Phrynocephalus forsythii]|uniref:Uncharacterized protein n=1 Tax=Phrynocephalus forsythii TaxID=171643 RepID=A0A9Q0XW99_9SAUR|nr:hypothetical protein JRQ81_014194 [Phrynocephalus forsythii]